MKIVVLPSKNKNYGNNSFSNGSIYIHGVKAKAIVDYPNKQFILN